MERVVYLIFRSVNKRKGTFKPRRLYPILGSKKLLLVSELCHYACRYIPEDADDFYPLVKYVEIR